ncbi:MAG: type II toxin-antitoxin system prevent-host-death family antitoxin [Oscillospiraceae bacterium]|nr:type II toxin-antitoxin system prevent-host-death family antitoxin [Oscillospiraceae bacterium]
MPNIKPVSDLRNYNEVLRDIAMGQPVFLTKNGRGRYALMDLQEYEKMRATMRLFSELNHGCQSAAEQGWQSLDEVEAELGVAQ